MNSLETNLNNYNDSIHGEYCGTITISVYKEILTDSHIFYLKCDNDSIVHICDIIEDVLKLY